jgi:hypothetical protein
MKAVQGKVFYKQDRILDRIKVLFTDALGQSFVRLKRMPVLALTLIFFGFPAVQPHSPELCACTEFGRLCENQRLTDMTGKPQSPKRVIQDTRNSRCLHPVLRGLCRIF